MLEIFAINIHSNILQEKVEKLTIPDLTYFQCTVEFMDDVSLLSCTKFSRLQVHNFSITSMLRNRQKTAQQLTEAIYILNKIRHYTTANMHCVNYVSRGAPKNVWQPGFAWTRLENLVSSDPGWI